MIRTRISNRVLSLLIILIIIGVSFNTVSSKPEALEGAELEESVSVEIYPDAESDFADVPPLTTGEQEALFDKLLALRDQQVALVDNHVGEESGDLLDAYAEEILIADYESQDFAYLPPDSNFMIGRNRRNTQADNTGNSTLAETVAIDDGRAVFYGGNKHFEYSLNRGATWINVSIPGGPADAPFGCCDPDIVYDRARGLTIRSYLYLNAGGTNGVVRFFVHRNVWSSPSCSYTIDPAGGANNLVPDYPHLGLSNDFLYITVNNVGTGTNGSQVYRFPLHDIGECASSISGSVYTYDWSYGQRIFVPVEGAREIMYWGASFDSNDFRVYSWPENSGTISWTTRGVNAANFTNPDCRGGVGNYDFIERGTGWSIAGFNHRGAVGPNGLLFLWNVASDGSHPHAHVHSALFRESDLTVIGQPHIWSSGICVGYPALSVNDRGDYGLSIAAGGQSGGGGSAAQGYVSIDDDFTSGAGRFDTIYITASGTHNRTDGRFGDYFSVRRDVPCGNWFAATNYSLKNGRAITNVNARYVNFGRGRDYGCYIGWTFRSRQPLP